MLLSLYLAVLDDQSNEEQFIDVYNTYKRLVYHTAYKIMGDSYLAEDVLQEVFLYVAKNFSKIHRENCHELAAYLVSCSRSRAYDMLRKQREEPLEEVPDAPDDAPVPDDAVVSTDNIQHLTELIGQIKPMASRWNSSRMDTATIMCRMDLNEIVSRNLKELKTFCTFTRQKKAVRDIPFDAPLYSRGNSPHLTMSIQHIRM